MLKNYNEETGFRFINTGLDPDRDPVNLMTPTPRTQFNQAYETIKRVTGADANLMELFLELLRDDGFKPANRFKDPYARMAASPEVIEVSIWDNWLGDVPVKGNPQRYGVKIKAWNKADVDFHAQDDVDFTASVSLKTPAALRKTAATAQMARTPTAKKGFTKPNKNPISPEFAEMIEFGCDMMEEAGLAGGLLTSKPTGYGTIRSDRQMMFVDTSAILAGDMSARAIILIDEATKITLPAWTTTDAKGNPLRESFNPDTGKHAKCVAQIRYARDTERFASWMAHHT